MKGRRAALKVAAKNALRNRKRTVFLVLLVGVPVALGVFVAGIVRASNFTPEEAAQLEFGTADVHVQVQGGEEVVEWVYENARAIDPALTLTDFRRTGLRLEDFQFALASDLDLAHPLTDGMLVVLDGEVPDAPGEAAISPRVADNMDLEIGDRREFDDLAVGEVEIVGIVSEPIANSDATVLLWAGALDDEEQFTTVLVGGEGAEAAAARLDELWWSEGQPRFWPEPAVDPKPVELQELEDEFYVFLTERQVEELVELARTDSEGGFQAVFERAWEMVYGSGGPPQLASVYMETRSQRLSQGSIESNSALLSTAASTLLLIEVAFVTGAAFAAGTRRRLREIGLLGASGASEKHIRTTVIGEGLTIALVGSGLGVLLGIAVLLLGRPLLHRFVTRLITGLGVSVSDILGPVAVALVSVLIAVWIPAKTASKIPTITALQGRMPSSPPRRWVIPAGLIASSLGGLLITVSIASTSNFSPALVAIGGVMVVGGVAMLASPILAGVSTLADHVPATGRLVLRDSARHRTRSAVAVAAIMVILLAPAILATMSETSAQQDLLYGLPEPSNQLLLLGGWDQAFGPTPIGEDDIATVAAVVPERQLATFETLELRIRTKEQMEIEAVSDDAQNTIQLESPSNRAAVATASLVSAIGDERVGEAIANDRIVVLGVEDKETFVSIDHEEVPAVEFAVPVVRWSMPRVLLPASVAAQYQDAESRPMALFILDRPLSDREQVELSGQVDFSGGRDYMPAGMTYAIGAGVTLLAVLIVISLVTAVSAAEVDEELRTIVAVGAPGSFRRRFLGLLTGYQTLIGAALAVPLGLGLIKVFTSARQSFYQGPFGQLSNSDIFIPWLPLIALIVLTPFVVGLLTLVSVRSAPVTPPRRAT
ncbi:MAG TPA: ABC transporter permease [Acidimicrobiia bacterium]|nr:ABC transporter permease [Acidimicrobiia bacterium]